MKYLNMTGIGIALLALAGTTAAQPQQEQGGQYQPPAQQQPQQQQQSQISDAKLEKFSAAMAEVRSVQQEYASAIQEADSTDEAQTLRADAQDEMRGAVEDTGLSISEYNQISQRLQSDQDLVRRLQEIDGQ